MWTFITLAITLVGIIYFYMKNILNYWKKKGVPYPKPLLIFGNVIESFMIKKSLGMIAADIYRKYDDCKYVGFFKMMQPTVIVRDPELIKKLLITDFNHFEANDVEVDEEYDVLLGKSPFVMQGHRWKTVRGQITPAFTTNKLKLMHPLMNEVGDKFVTYMNKLVDAGNGKCLDAKELSLKFTTENVASCAFGLNGGAFEEEDSEFVKRSKEIGKVSFLTILKLNILTIAPSLSKVLKVKFFNDYITDYLISVVSQTIKYREENNVVRNDFLDMMIQLKHTCTEYKFTDMDAVAQAAGFFVDGVETSASNISYIIYEIAKNQHVQEKLQNSIDEAIKKHGKIDYDVIQGLTYLDCVIDETMRLHAPIPALFKRCTKNYTTTSATNGSDVIIEAGTSILIPVEGLHHDPKYFKDPEVFKPERFDDEHKNEIIKCTYLPFGEGHRVCLGRRFAVLQMKAALVSIFANFNVKVNDKTAKKLEVHPGGIIRTPVGGIWIDIFKRK